MVWFAFTMCVGVLFRISLLGREKGGVGVGLYVAVCYKLFSHYYLFVQKIVYILLFSSIVQDVEASLL